jgi:translocator protein
MKTLLYILLCQAVGVGSALGTRSGRDGWYDELAKPAFNPPSAVFGPVWTVLYCLMGVAAARVHHDKVCRVAFFVQLGLNGLWSVLFFGMRQPGWALLEIVCLWAAIAYCVKEFARVDRWAARLMWPYLAWVSFAFVLNFEIWRLNAG